MPSTMPSAIPSAVRRSLEILAASRALLRPGEEARPMEERIARVVALFRQTGARWALVGAHAVGTLTEPRATVDFDFVIEESKFRTVLDALGREFGDLDPVDLGPALRLRALDVDLIRSGTHLLFREALDRVRTVGDWKLPVPEVLVVLKFLAAVNPWRDRTKRMQDMVDLRALYLAVGRDALDLDLMKRLSSSVYPGAETEFEALLGRLERGEPISI